MSNILRYAVILGCFLVFRAVQISLFFQGYVDLSEPALLQSVHTMWSAALLVGPLAIYLAENIFRRFFSPYMVMRREHIRDVIPPYLKSLLIESFILVCSLQTSSILTLVIINPLITLEELVLLYGVKTFVLVLYYFVAFVFYSVLRLTAMHLSFAMILLEIFLSWDVIARYSTWCVAQDFFLGWYLFDIMFDFNGYTLIAILRMLAFCLFASSMFLYGTSRVGEKDYRISFL